MTFVDPKSDCCGRSKDGKGFVKRGTKFIVSDDLIVTPKISSSTFSVLKKFQILTDDLEVQAITISNADVKNLLYRLNPFLFFQQNYDSLYFNIRL